MLLYVEKRANGEGFFPIFKCEDGQKMEQVTDAAALDDSQIVPSIAAALNVAESRIEFHEDCGTHEIWRVLPKREEGDR